MPFLFSSISGHRPCPEDQGPHPIVPSSARRRHDRDRGGTFPSYRRSGPDIFGCVPSDPTGLRTLCSEQHDPRHIPPSPRHISKEIRPLSPSSPRVPTGPYGSLRFCPFFLWMSPIFSWPYPPWIPLDPCGIRSPRPVPPTDGQVRSFPLSLHSLSFGKAPSSYRRRLLTN